MTPLTEERRALAASAVGVAASVAARMSRHQPWHREDIESAAMLGVCRAAVSYAGPSGGEFEDYAAVCAWRAVKIHFREAKRPRRWPSGRSVVQVDDFNRDASRHMGPSEEAEFNEGIAGVKFGEYVHAKAGRQGVESPPCVECGTKGGAWSEDTARPVRKKGMCHRCYNRAARRAWRAKRKQSSPVEA